MARRTAHRPATFADLHRIARTSADDWFDPRLHTDTDLFVDPFLMFDSTDVRWTAVHDRMIAFFNQALTHVAASTRRGGRAETERAAAMFSFPEPPQFCLGYGERTIFGHGSARGLGEAMLAASRQAIDAGIDHIDDFGELMLFGDGFGADRVSDMTCNIVMDLFIGYTHDVVERHSIPTKPFTVQHAGYDVARSRWRKVKANLPVNPCWAPAPPVLLVPKDFLDELPRMDDTAFWDWIYTNENEQLRKDLGYLITSKVNRDDIIAAAKRRPKLVRKYGISYAKRYREQPPKPYDFGSDPRFKVTGLDAAAHFAHLARFEAPGDDSSFCDFVASLVADFKWAVEDRGLWKSFWSGTRPFAEDRVQDLFHMAILLSCRDRDIDVSPEANSGAGPVDFKFSSGWSRRALVEIKFAKSSSYWDNLEQQAPTYMRSEAISCGFILIVQHEDRHCTSEFIARTTGVVETITNATGRSYRAVFVDARPKISASKKTRRTP